MSSHVNNKLLVNVHYCTREEYEELIRYLTENSWDHKLLTNEEYGKIKSR